MCIRDRLVAYNKRTDVVDVCFEGKENDEIELLLNASSNGSRKIELLMEIRQAHETFPIYKPGGNSYLYSARHKTSEGEVADNSILCSSF